MNQSYPAHQPKKRLRFKFLKWACVISLVCMIGAVFYAPLLVYSRFNQAVPIAKLHFEQINPHLYKAHLRSGDFCQTHTFLLTGDQWQLDASFLKFTGAAVLLGFESRYQLDRLSGRFQNITDQNTFKPDAYDLTPEVWFDFFDTQPTPNDDAWFVDTTYGSSVYLSMQPYVDYTVYKTEDGLIVKGDPATLDLSDGNTITITRSCAHTDNVIAGIMRSVNALFVRLIN